jgi:hypothetical protein
MNEISSDDNDYFNADSNPENNRKPFATFLLIVDPLNIRYISKNLLWRALKEI